MLDLSAVRSRLTLALAPTPVSGAAEFAAIQDTGLARAPAIWVVPLNETAEATRLNQGVQQRVQVTLGLVYAVRDVRDATGSAAQDSLSDLRETVFDQLLGWQPDTATGEPFTYAGGGLLRFINALLFWQDQFSVYTYLRAT